MKKAIDNLKITCEKHICDRYRIVVVDLEKHPEIAAKEQILAIPTVIRKLPPPLKRLIGDLSAEQKVLVGLDILPKE